MALGYFILLSVCLTVISVSHYCTVTPFYVCCSRRHLKTLWQTVSGQFLNCKWVNNLDCVHYQAFQMCASNGKEYSNRCYLAKAQCSDSTLRTIKNGHCASFGVSTPAPASTMPPIVAGSTGPTGPTTTREPVFVNHNQLLDFFCLELMHEQCPSDTEKVCGTDGVTYANFCEYEKQRCGHRDLMVKNFGLC